MRFVRPGVALGVLTARKLSSATAKRCANGYHPDCSALRRSSSVPGSGPETDQKRRSTDDCVLPGLDGGASAICCDCISATVNRLETELAAFASCASSAAHSPWAMLSYCVRTIAAPEAVRPMLLGTHMTGSEN